MWIIKMKIHNDTWMVAEHSGRYKGEKKHSFLLCNIWREILQSYNPLWVMAFLRVCPPLFGFMNPNQEPIFSQIFILSIGGETHVESSSLHPACSTRTRGNFVVHLFMRWNLSATQTKTLRADSDFTYSRLLRTTHDIFHQTIFFPPVRDSKRHMPSWNQTLNTLCYGCGQYIRSKMNSREKQKEMQ